MQSVCNCEKIEEKKFVITEKESDENEDCFTRECKKDNRDAGV